MPYRIQIQLPLQLHEIPEAELRQIVFDMLTQKAATGHLMDSMKLMVGQDLEDEAYEHQQDIDRHTIWGNLFFHPDFTVSQQPNHLLVEMNITLPAECEWTEAFVMEQLPWALVDRARQQHMETAEKFREQPKETLSAEHINTRQEIVQVSENWTHILADATVSISKTTNTKTPKFH